MAIQIPSGVADILRKVAPTLAAALAGPFAPIAATVVSAALEAWLPQQDVVGQAVNATPIQPSVIVDAVQANASDPKFILRLREAEIDLKKYEQQTGIKFAELEIKDRMDARVTARESGLARPLFFAGMVLIVLSLTIMLLTIGGCLALLFGMARLPSGTSPDMAAAVFGLIGQTIGFINGMSGVVVAFYWGGSQGDHTSNSRIADTMQDLARASVEQAKAIPAQPSPAPQPSPGPSQDFPQPELLDPAVPTPAGLLAEILPGLIVPHKHFPDGVSWALTPDGISIEGAPAQGTPGEPATIRTIWKRYGDLCSAAAKRYGVPVELICATIAAESRGQPNARRAEPKINDASSGLMQTLKATARQALGRRDLSDDDLLDPATSINAGTAYIAQQRGSTHFDPPLVAAAYNAGSLRRDSGAANRWKLLVYPTGTGRHIDSFVSWFNDCMRVSREEGWGKEEGVPSFASCVPAAMGPHPPT